jgi:hypothetical protein
LDLTTARKSLLKKKKEKKILNNLQNSSKRANERGNSGFPSITFKLFGYTLCQTYNKQICSAPSLPIVVTVQADQVPPTHYPWPFSIEKAGLEKWYF